MKRFLLCFCTAIIVIIFSRNFLEFTHQGMFVIKNFIACKGNYDLLRQSIPLANIAVNAQEIIPANACVESSLSKINRFIDAVTLKYYLFPLKLRDYMPNEYNKTSVLCHGHYFIDLDHSIKVPPVGSKSVDLPGETRVFALAGAPLRIWPLQGQASQYEIFGRFFLFNFIVLMTGCFIFCGLFPQTKSWGWGENCSSSFLIGFVHITLIFWFLALRGVPLSWSLINFILFVMLLLSYVFMRLRKASLSVILGTIKTQSFLEGILGIITCLILCFFVLYIISLPVMIYDEMNIWLLKAKMFFYHQGLVFDYTEYDNNYYPVLWPLNIAIQYIFIGGAYDQVAKWTSAIIFVCLIGQLKFIGHLLGFDRRARLTVILIFLVCFHHWTFFTALAENVYIALVAFAVAFFIFWMGNQQRGTLYLVSMAWAALSGVKFEGIFIVGFLLFAYVLSGRLTAETFWKKVELAVALSMPFIIYGLWLAWLNIKHIPYFIFHWQRHLSFNNVPALFKMCSYFFVQKETMLIIAVLAVPLLSKINKEWSREEKFLLIFSICLILFSLSAGLLWPIREYILYYPEVLTRLFSRIMPFLVLWWMSRINVSKNRGMNVY